MNWDAIGAIAEMLAAAGVIISLIFVGLQVRKSNLEARAATMQATTDTEIFMNATLVRHADTWQKVVLGGSVEDDVEIRRGIVLFNMMMTDNENRFHQFKAGYLDDRSWGMRLTLLNKTVMLPIFDHWRQSYGGQGHEADFLDLIDSIRADAIERQGE